MISYFTIYTKISTDPKSQLAQVAIYTMFCSSLYEQTLLHWGLQVYYKEKGLFQMHPEKSTLTTIWCVLLVHWALVINSCCVDLGENNLLSHSRLLLGDRVLESSQKSLHKLQSLAQWQMVFGNNGEVVLRS